LRLALVLARAGETDRARQLAEAVDNEFPAGTLVQNYSLPSIRAAIELRNGDANAAIQELRAAKPYDLAYPEDFNSLTPAYLRGLAYLSAGNGQQAAAQFQKVIDHPGIVGRSVLGALARLQLARSQKLAGNSAAARDSYVSFLTLWRNADHDIPVLIAAKAEYLLLQ
jgi:tetratricopeptide (TPR) repeat protein